MLARSSRSRSRTVESAPPKDQSISINPIPPISPVTKPTSTPSTHLPTESHDSNHDMISTITRQSSAAPLGSPATSVNGADQAQPDIQDDDRSSSLSDLDEGTDEPADISVSNQNQFQDSEVDSETETERLERTPQKLAASANNPIVEKSPSKLAQEILVDGTEDDIDKANSILSGQEDHLSPAKDLALEGADVERDAESPNRKRKRSESAVSSLSDTDEPLAKRSHSARYQVDAAMSSTETLNHQHPDIGQDPEAVEQEGDETIIAEEGQEIDALEPAVPARGRKGRKGKRKGRRAAADAELDQPAEAADDTLQETTETVEIFVEEEEDSTRDEEIAKKRLAIDALTKIEKEFTAFREKHINQQLQQITQELELLRQPSSTHAEYQAQLRCIDDYRDEKIRYQDTLYKYKFGALQVKTVAEREQMQSQYFQEVREIRDKSIAECYKNMYALQKDRRRWGADETNYERLYHPKRDRQIAQQAAYNLEVSILSGVAKYVGFPAAPDLPSLQDGDVESDLRFMKIPERPIQPRNLLRDAERNAAANNEFFEQNAWANPSVAHAILNAQNFATPHRMVSNGSTVDGTGPGSQMVSQNLTPQGNHVSESTEGIGMTKPSPLSNLTKLTTQAEPGPTVSTVGTIGFPTSALHGTEVVKESPANVPAAVGISVGGGRGFGQ